MCHPKNTDHRCPGKMKMWAMQSCVRAHGWKGQLSVNDPHQGCHRRASAWSGRSPEPVHVCILTPTPRMVNVGQMSDWLRQHHDLLGWNIRALERKHGAAWSQHRPVGARAALALGARGRRTQFILSLLCAESVHISYLLCLMAIRERHGLSPWFRSEELPGSLSSWGAWKAQHWALSPALPRAVFRHPGSCWDGPQVFPQVHILPWSLPLGSSLRQALGWE